jgi:MFS family permease
LPILVAIPLAWFVIRNTPAEKGIEAEQVNPDSTQLRSSHFVQPWNTATILRDRGFQVIAVSFVPPTVAFYGILQNLAPYAHDLGYTAETSASFMSMIGGSTVVGKILFGGLADRFDKRYLFWLAIAGLATAMSIMAEGPSNSWLMLFVSALIGLTTGSLLPLMGAFVGDRFSPSEFGRVMGLLYPFIAMSSVGALIAGWMRDQFGAYGPAFWIYVLLLIPAALIMAVLPEPPNEGSLAAEVPQGHS